MLTFISFHSPSLRPFLRFVYEGVAYHYTAFPFGLPLAWSTFTKCMNAALSSLRQAGIRIIRIYSAKSFLSPRKGVTFLVAVIDSARLRVWITLEHSLNIQQLVASFKVGAVLSHKAFQRLLLIAAASSLVPMGLFHMQPLQY